MHPQRPGEVHGVGAENLGVTVTHLLGRQKLLTERDVEKLQSVRAKYVTALNHGHKNGGRERSSRQGTGTKSH